MRSPHGTTIRGILQCEYYLDLFCVLINDVIDVPFHSCSRLFVDSNLYIMFYVLCFVVCCFDAVFHQLHKYDNMCQ